MKDYDAHLKAQYGPDLDGEDAYLQRQEDQERADEQNREWWLDQQ